MIFYLYIHGFASGPRSYKAEFLKKCFQDSGLSLRVPDFNENDFYNLTPGRKIARVRDIIAASSEPVTIIGSSLGGLAAVISALDSFKVERLVLLAPAFGFSYLLNRILGEENLEIWRSTGSLAIYHYGERRSIPLNYNFVTDLARYADISLDISLPTLILHGTRDEVIPIEYSRDFAKNNPSVILKEFNSDHSLTDVMPEIWLDIKKFCSI